MNLISCDRCAVVLDANKLPFPSQIHTEEGNIDYRLAAWDGEEYVPITPCPHCRADILKP